MSKALSQELTDLHCPLCSERVWDNRFRKADPNNSDFTQKHPDFVCSNDGCSGAKMGKSRLLRTSWYAKDLNGNPKELPKEWNINS